MGAAEPVVLQGGNEKLERENVELKDLEMGEANSRLFSSPPTAPVPGSAAAAAAARLILAPSSFSSHGAAAAVVNSLHTRPTGKLIGSSKYELGGHTQTKCRLELLQWLFLSGQAAFIVGACSSPSMAEDVSTSSKNDTSKDDFSGLRKVEDGSVISNEHTSKWRVFTDNGRDYFSKGNIDQAERFFLSALHEAKEGFGERDPHVASACNNLAELYRVTKDFDKADCIVCRDIIEGCYFQKGRKIKMEMSAKEAFERSMRTLSEWISQEVNRNI
ncbi:uncharacterized protein LOC131002580 [Salvia miltiorrhiza]|uniref:uncharacterized protein LOC131002580 n=1 Tax=Salvia miltiorrhiza TaxID=226208 RepID=UPI0025AD4B4A|nr:uncharacterized protein LOC131002580 [Salvia miltiorrhiza]